MFTGLLTKIIKTLSFRRILTVSLTVLVGIIALTVYENRNRIFAAAQLTVPVRNNMVGSTFTVGEDTRTEIDQRVKKDSSIIGMSVSTADLRLNESHVLFFSSDDTQLTTIVNNQIDVNDFRSPIFSQNDENNIEVIKLINGNFSCSSFHDTLQARLTPEMGSTAKMICRSSIPSYYGYFSGFVTVYLNEQYSVDRQAMLKITTDRLSVDIYFRDVLPTQKRQTPKSYTR